jgi:hypothetical protein
VCIIARDHNAILLTANHEGVVGVLKQLSIAESPTDSLKQRNNLHSSVLHRLTMTCVDTEGTHDLLCLRLSKRPHSGSVLCSTHMTPHWMPRVVLLLAKSRLGNHALRKYDWTMTGTEKQYAPQVPSWNTYLTKRALQSSSSRVNAYMARQVLPRRIRVSASNDSRMWLRSSSGSLANEPHRDLMFSEAVYALPAGLMPSGCEGRAIATSSSSFREFAAADVFLLLEGDGSDSGAQARLRVSIRPGAMSKANYW